MRTEIRKWIHYFENIPALMFIALSNYDQIDIDNKVRKCDISKTEKYRFIVFNNNSIHQLTSLTEGVIFLEIVGYLSGKIYVFVFVIRF